MERAFYLRLLVAKEDFPHSLIWSCFFFLYLICIMFGIMSTKLADEELMAFSWRS